MFSYADRIIPPSFTRKLKETPCVLGSSALLECKVSGSPPISVAWFQNGLKLVSGEKHQISFSDNLCILEVNSLSHSDTGTYTCKPIILEGTYTGSLPISVTWKKNGHTITQSQKCSITTTEKSCILEILDSTKEDAGEYTCHLENEAGRDVLKGQHMALHSTRIPGSTSLPSFLDLLAVALTTKHV
uniref:Ig-like domain-containing protein n=1 Tax=Ficedula albicollis TaxID=59894 RepID=A0A803VT07_FICAL